MLIRVISRQVLVRFMSPMRCSQELSIAQSGITAFPYVKFCCNPDKRAETGVNSIILQKKSRRKYF